MSNGNHAWRKRPKLIRYPDHAACVCKYPNGFFFVSVFLLQFYADANETESWLREKMPLVRSTDCGEDGPGAQALLARHRDLEGQIRAYEGDIQGLNAQADRLVASGVTSLALGSPSKSTMENGTSRGEPDGEWGEEIRMVPEEYSEEESCERTEYRTVTEERLVPQVKAIYAFEGQGMTMAKGEVFVQRYEWTLETGWLISYHIDMFRFSSSWTKPTTTGGTCVKDLAKTDSCRPTMSKRLRASASPSKSVNLLRLRTSDGSRRRAWPRRRSPSGNRNLRPKRRVSTFSTITGEKANYCVTNCVIVCSDGNRVSGPAQEEH